MKGVVPILALERNGYSADHVKAALHSSNRRVAFRYDLLDSSNNFKAALTTVLAGHVDNNAMNDVKRTSTFTIRDDGTINFLSDRIKPWTRVRMTDGGYAEFPLGVFVLSTPPRKTDPSGVITRDIEGYDLLQVLKDDEVDTRYTVTAGTKYTDAIKNVLSGAGITQMNITDNSSTLPTDMDWDIGTPKLTICNDLATAINYKSMTADADGYIIGEPYMTPDVRPPEYTYADDDQSVIFPDVQESFDLFGVPNKWIRVVSEPDRPPLVSVYTNTNANSPTSTVNRGRTIVDFQSGVNAPDQSTLDALTQRAAYEASQVYQEVTFNSAIMPMHADLDVLTLNYTGLGISAKYVETSWGFDLQAGARMQHTIRRTVSI